MLPLTLVSGALALAAIVLLTTHLRRQRRERRLEAVRSAWGKTQARERTWDFLRWFDRVSAPQPTEARRIDAQTWADLQLDEIFSRADQTLTLPGQLVLYRMLRWPLMSPAPLERRNQIASRFHRDRALRERTQLALLPLRDVPGGDDLAELLWEPLPDPGWLPVAYRAMTALSVSMVAAALFLGGLWYLALFGVFGLNFYLHHRIKTGWGTLIAAFRYLGRLLGVSRRLAALEHDGGLALEELGAAVKLAAPLRSRTASLGPVGSIDVLYEYVSVLFLLEARASLALLLDLKRLGHVVRVIFESVGDLDAHLAIASFRAGLESHAVPTLLPGSGKLLLEGAVHPLLRDPTPLSFQLDRKPVLVTGPNMAGKSTFLRTIGVNAVLAQTLSTCTALRYEADCFVILSSLAVDDDLRAGRSRYYAEAERLLTMIQSAQKERATLCLIDEILRGTNTTERIAAATEILRYLADSGATTLAATHDTEIAVDLGSLFETFHFSVRDDNGRMRFDHRPEPGISTSRNAIRMLSTLGFPEEIVEAALGRVAAREHH